MAKDSKIEIGPVVVTCGGAVDADRMRRLTKEALDEWFAALEKAAEAVGVPPELRPTVTLARGDKTDAELREEGKRLASKADAEAQRFSDCLRCRAENRRCRMCAEHDAVLREEFTRTKAAAGGDCQPVAPQPACPVARTPGKVEAYGTISIDGIGSVVCTERAEERHGETRVSIVCRVDRLGAYHDALARALDGRTPCQLALLGKDRWVCIRAKDSAVFVPGGTAEIVLSLVDYSPVPGLACPCCEELAAADELVCGARLDGHVCTLRNGHKGREHIAHEGVAGGPGHVAARWPVVEPASPTCCPHKRGPFWHDEDCPTVVQKRRDDEAAKRHAREARLVALVNAVPEWADPNAWRAAVLAVNEAHMGEPFGEWGDLREWLRAAVSQPVTIARSVAEAEAAKGMWTLHGSSRWHALAAYRRALAPAAKVTPERRDRGPRIVCDNGED